MEKESTHGKMAPLTEEGQYKFDLPVGTHVFTPKNGTPYLTIFNDKGKLVEE